MDNNSQIVFPEQLKGQHRSLQAIGQKTVEYKIFSASIIRQIHRKITVTYIVPLFVLHNIHLLNVMKESSFSVICLDEIRLGRAPSSGGKKI
jgi:hypothetical protein